MSSLNFILLGLLSFSPFWICFFLNLWF
jgi:hypothetical protein